MPLVLHTGEGAPGRKEEGGKGEERGDGGFLIQMALPGACHADLVPSGQGDLCLRTDPSGRKASELSSPAPASPGPRHVPQHQFPMLLPWAASQTRHLREQAGSPEAGGEGWRPTAQSGQEVAAVPSHLPEPGEPTLSRPPTGSARIGLVRGV